MGIQENLSKPKRNQSMNQKTLQKLEWQSVLDRLSQFCQTPEGHARSLTLTPTLTRQETLANWEHVEPMCLLAGEKRQPPIGELTPIAPLLRAASIGQILDGSQIAAIGILLRATQHVHEYLTAHAARCAPFAALRTKLHALTPLARKIAKTVDPEGLLLDEASEALSKIRRQKRSLRTRVEQKLKSLLSDGDLEKYLQDDFFTMRSERYVIPIRIDGRGRIPGSILDTSASGQTLFIEPAAIQVLNEELQELEVAEKLEIIRIFRELTREITSADMELSANYTHLIELDVAFSQAAFAHSLEATSIELTTEPTVDLRQARHPLIHVPEGGKVVANDIQFLDTTCILLISGPNAGGKTVVLKTLGLCLLFAKAGLLLPVHPRSRLFLFDNLYVELGDAQSITESLSTFSGHIKGLLPMVEHATSRDLALLDELAVGTEPQTGAALAQTLLEEFAARKTKVVATTHYDALKVLALQDPRFRNGSMEYALEDLTPTYRLLLDQPGQSYGLEVAEKMGLPLPLIHRAKTLKGHSSTELEHAIEVLNSSRQEFETLRQQCALDQQQAQESQARWQNEVDALQKSKKLLLERLASKHQEKLERLEREFYVSLEQFKKEKKQANAPAVRVQENPQLPLQSLKQALGDLRKETAPDLPGTPATWAQLHIGARVWILPLQKRGTIRVLGASSQDPLEVSVEALSFKVKFSDLRFLSAAQATPATQTHKKTSKKTPSTALSLVLPSSTNTLDLRGCEADEAASRMWKFLDSAVLRGDYAILLIHGHGTDTLKRTLRMALQQGASAYSLRFRPGETAEGGDGVTIVYID